MKQTRDQKRIRRHKHIRKTVSGTELKPRLAVYRSTKHIYAQIINDVDQDTLAYASDLTVNKGSKVEKAAEVGKAIAAAAQKAKITEVVFDRGGFKFHGRVKALAEAARESGLKF